MDYKELIVNLRSLHSAINPLAHQAAAAIEALEAQVNTCGSGAGCLHKDARIEALEATNSANMATCKGIIQGLESEVEADNRNLEQLSDEVNALRAQLTAAEQAQPERAQPEKPIAYFEFQERGFFWAPNTAIGPVPVARKVEPMPLYSNQQAQPERPINCGTGYCSCIECPYEQAQPEPTGLPFVPWSKEAEMMASWVEQAPPERASLSDDVIIALENEAARVVGNRKELTLTFARAIEAHHGIKQGGQQ